MSRLVYEAPDRKTVVFDLTRDAIAEIILGSDWAYWQGGNGEASISVALSDDDRAAYNGETTFPDGTRVRYAPNQPHVCITQPELRVFYIVWCDGDDRFIPHNGSGFEEFVVGEQYGVRRRIPRACLVAPEVAVQVLQEFIASRRRAEWIVWFDWYKLPDQYYEPVYDAPHVLTGPPCPRCDELESCIGAGSIRIAFSWYFWRLGEVTIEPHGALEAQAATARGPQGGLWLLRCQDCHQWWQVTHCSAYGDETWIKRVQLASVEEWLQRCRSAPGAIGGGWGSILLAFAIGGLLALMGSAWHLVTALR